MHILSPISTVFLLLLLNNAEGHKGRRDNDESSYLRPIRQLQTEEAIPCPVYPPDIKLNLTRADVQMIYNAHELNILVTRTASGRIKKVVEDQKDNPYYERFEGWGDINDQALVAKVAADSTCYISIMGSEAFNPFDQLQNLNFCDTKLDDTDCIVRSGYLDAYNTSYKDEFRRGVDSCVGSCGPNTQCPLVISGHSQGGAAAVVAAIDLHFYNPTTITFGSPRPIMIQSDALCTNFNAAKHFRFITTADAVYDNVPFGSTSGSSSLGWPLFIDGMDFPIYSPGFNNDDDREPTSSTLHDMDLYMDYINNMFKRNCFPVPVGLWPTGHACNENEECQGQYCNENICADLLPPEN